MRYCDCFSEMAELAADPSRRDVTPISGILSYEEGQSLQSLSVSSVQDVEAETNEVFSVKLIASKGGASVSSQSSLAKLTGMTIQTLILIDYTASGSLLPN